MLLEKIKSLAKQHQAENISIRRHLHANPELSYQEFETSKYVQAQLKAIGIWIGLFAGLTVAGGLLFWRFHMLTKRLIVANK